ncbi:MAG: ATP-binding protein [Sphingomonas sp.]|nr:ATP-binding protein [Sphingomonas sp.]
MTEEIKTIAGEQNATPQMHDAKKLKVIVIGPNDGGVRKTKTALLLGSIAKASGLTTMFVCADSGIGSLSASLKLGGPNPVELFERKEMPDYAAVLVAQAREHKADVVVIDLGANEMLNSASRRTLRAALPALRTLGHETHVILSVIPQKVGLEEDASQFARRMESCATISLAVHGADQDGELSKFRELMADYQHFHVSSDHGAILHLTSKAGVTPFDWVLAPPSQFTMAAGLMAHNLLKLAKQGTMMQMFGSAQAIGELEKLARSRPHNFYTNRNAEWQVHDDALAADEAEIQANHRLLALSDDAADIALVPAARAYIAASRMKVSAYRGAMQACT